jgi:hypothetical protein
MTEVCQNCSNEVSDTFARVFGDNQNDVHACHGCLPTRRQVSDGVVAGLNPDARGTNHTTHHGGQA